MIQESNDVICDIQQLCPQCEVYGMLLMLSYLSKQIGHSKGVKPEQSHIFITQKACRFLLFLVLSHSCFAFSGQFLELNIPIFGFGIAD